MRYSRLTAMLAAATLTMAACGGGSDSTATTADADSTATTADSTTDSMADTTTESMADGGTTESVAGPTVAPDGEGTIVDVAASNPDFSTLVAAVEAAGLADALSTEGPFTVFAPTNEAFDEALSNLGMTAEELFANTPLLTEVLTYHVVAGDVPAATVATMNGQMVPTLNGASVLITVEGDSVMVNDANVTAVDIVASNGVIHVIDKVLLPPADGESMDDGESMEDGESMDDGESTGSTVAGDADSAADSSSAAPTENIIEVANGNPDFSILVQAAGAAGLFVTLANDGPFTVFAPTNEAFEQALSDLGMTADELLADKDLLAKVLSYHVVSGEYLAADVVGLDSTEVDTVEGSPITITVDGDKVMVNDANVTATDVMATNGVIHVIDKVLLPPSD